MIQFVEDYNKKMWWKSLALLLATPALSILTLFIGKSFPSLTELLHRPNAEVCAELVLEFMIIAVAVGLFHGQLKQTAEALFRGDRKERRRRLSLVYLFLLMAFLVQFLAVALVTLVGQNRNEQGLVAMQAENNPALYLLFAVLLGPIREELIFRFGMFRCINLWSRWGAHTVSALLFGLMHVWEYVVFDQEWGQLIIALPYCLFGVLCSLLYEKTSSIFYPILLHVLMNGIVELISIL